MKFKNFFQQPAVVKSPGGKIEFTGLLCSNSENATVIGNKQAITFFPYEVKSAKVIKGKLTIELNIQPNICNL